MGRRVLLKISGEALMGPLPYGIDMQATNQLATRLCELQKSGCEIGVVMGGGNIFRGMQQAAEKKLDRVTADQMGMLATIMNGLGLKNALLDAGCKAHLLSAIDCPTAAEKYSQRRAHDLLGEGHILLFVGGTGHPFFTTDTAAALRACEIKADILLKGTMRVEGVYSDDPHKNNKAIKYDTISYTEFVEKKLGVLDLTAVTLCMSNQIPIRVFNLNKGSLVEAISKDAKLGTLIQGA